MLQARRKEEVQCEATYRLFSALSQRLRRSLGGAFSQWKGAITLQMLQEQRLQALRVHVLTNLEYRVTKLLQRGKAGAFSLWKAYVWQRKAALANGLAALYEEVWCSCCTAFSYQQKCALTVSLWP